MKHTRLSPARLALAAALALFFALVLTTHPSWAQDSSTQKELLILHTNDFHGALLPEPYPPLAPGPVGGAAYMAAAIERERRPGTLLLDAGDCAVGTPLSTLFHGIPVIEYMNMMHYDAMSLGNHEYDWPRAELGKMAACARFPFLCVNVREKKTGATPSYMKPYAVVERSGLKIGIIGVTTQKTAYIGDPRSIGDLEFLPAENPIMEAIDELHHKGVRVIILLSHLGIDEDRAIAKKIPALTCIIGGHSHTAMQAPEQVGDVLIVQAGKKGRYLGRLKLSLEHDKVVSHEGSLIPIIDRDIVPDPAVEALLAPYQEKARHTTEKLMGTAADDIMNDPLPGSQSTPLGSLMCDAICAVTGADMALYRSHELQGGLHRGGIHKQELLALFPSDHRVIVAELTGADLEKMLQCVLSYPYLYQVSGFTITFFGKEKPPAILYKGVPLDPAKKYRFAAPGFFFFFYQQQGGFDLANRRHVRGPLGEEVLEQFITEKKDIAPSVEKRVTGERAQKSDKGDAMPKE